jgi:hypothetical protein
MGFFDRLFGTEPSRPNPRRVPPPPASDAQALERYRYMLQTAPPETIEQAHQEAFAKLTPEQRRQVVAGLAEAAPEGERAAVAATSIEDTKALARTATRAEIRQPGVMERTLGGGAMGFGANLLSSFAMGFVGSMVASSFLSALGGSGDEGGHSEGEGADAGHDGDGGDQLADYGGDDGGGMDGGDFEV